jgi:cytochrome b6-f complex iron-sulfur subunit
MTPEDSPQTARPSAAAPPAARPAPAAAAKETAVNRRKFLSWLGVAWLSFSGSMAVAALQMGRFMFPNVLFEPPLVFKVGFPEDFAVGAVDERFKERNGIWVVRGDKEIYALISVCTHLGCTPNWLAAEEKFKCPCHGSGFYTSGINFEGPAPRPLERAAIALSDDGQIVVDKGRKFLQEKGQWMDPDSFLTV